MEQSNEMWQQLTLPFSHEMKNVLEQQHLAVQFTGLAGRHLIPEEKDKSNINLQFLPLKKIFIGKELPQGLRIAFHPESHTLQIRKSELETIREISLEGKTFMNAFQQLTTALGKLDVDVLNMTTEQPYALPSDSLKEGKYFFKDETELIEENIRYRKNASLVLQKIVSEYDDTDLMRIWPHHFDTGTIIRIEKNRSGETIKSIGLGFAIPDKMMPEPYFYLSYWSESSNSSIEIPQNLPAGKWMMPEWDGAVLTISEITQLKSSKEQFDLVKSYFEAGIKKSIAILKLD